MSLRVKKGASKKLEQSTAPCVTSKCTPVKEADHPERKKTKSSMKKLKKFLKSRSKAKSFCSDSPSAEQLRATDSAALYKKGTGISNKDLQSAKRCRSNEMLPQDCNGSEKPSKRLRSGPETDSRIKNEEDRSLPSLRVTPFNSVVTKSASDKSTTFTRSKNMVCSSPSDAEELFKSVISPVTITTFFKEIWEKKPLLIRRHDSSYNKGWFSTEELDHILREELVKFGDNVDVVTYLNGKRETHNPEGRAYAPVVWDYYQNGCSVRLLNPHSYSDHVWSGLSQLQEYFGCVAGANVYLTPPGSQGFAPHWDDIEAFILQLEGKKHWRVYEPRNETEILPREPSPNFSDQDLTEPPVLDAVLEPGDLLYFPRGFIHQGRTLEDSHSLHITLSVGQKNTWGDLLQKLIPRALELAVEEDVEFRRSLPHNYLNYMGVAFSDELSTERSKFLKTVQRLVSKLLPLAPVDAACDQMAKQLLQNSLPPVLSEEERQCSVHGHGEHWDIKSGRVRGAVELEPDTEIRIIRRGSLRLVTEENKVFIYHNMENARMLHEEDVHCIEVEPQMAEAVEFLLKHYPEFTVVDSLPLDTVQERVALAADLYDKGLIMTREPIESLSDDDSSCDCSDSS